MKLIAKTLEKVILELTAKEIEVNGFDFFWDAIRNNYKASEYEVYSIGSSPDDKNLIYIELTPVSRDSK